MKKWMVLFGLVAGVGSSIYTIAPSVEANDSIPAMAGHAWPRTAANEFCYSHSYGQVTMTCGDGNVWIVPLPVHTNQNVTFLATASGGGLQSTTCKAIEQNGTSLAAAFTSTVSYSSTSTLERKTLGTLFINTGNNAHIECDVGTGFSGVNGTLSTMEFN